MKRYRKTERGGGLFSAIEHEQTVAAKTNGTLKLCDVIPRESFRPLLEELTGYATRHGAKGGKPPSTPCSSSKSSCYKNSTASATMVLRSKSLAAPALKTSQACASATTSLTPKHSGISNNAWMLMDAKADAEELLDDKDQAVLAYSAYHSAQHEEHLIKLNAQEFLMCKAKRGDALSEKEQQTNHTISRMRE